MSKLNGKNVTKVKPNLQNMKELYPSKSINKPQSNSKKLIKQYADEDFPVVDNQHELTPDGYIVARGDDDFYDPVDWEQTPEIRGRVISVKQIELKKAKKGQPTSTRVLSFTDTNNVGWSIWEKKQLETIFNVVQPGTEIIITHIGMQEIPGRALPMHKFRCLYRTV